MRHYIIIISFLANGFVFFSIVHAPEAVAITRTLIVYMMDAPQFASPNLKYHVT